MELRVEPDDAAPSMPSSSSSRHGQMPNRFGVRPRDVPERDDRRARQPLADHPRQRARSGSPARARSDRRVGLLARRRRRTAVDAPGSGASPRAERRARVRDVAERPQALVGEAVVVAALLLGGEPHAAQRVRLLAGRHAHAAVRVDGLAIGDAAAVRDPDARARAHHRLERGDQAARRVQHLHGRPRSRSWM